MKTRLGGLLAIVLGAVLLGTGLSTTDTSAGTTSVVCGSLPVGVSTSCPVGHIDITKVVHGTGTAPAGGWVFTIASANCELFPGTSSTVTVPAAGGTVASGELFSTNFSNTTTGAGTACEYTVTETAVAGWTTTKSPTGTITLGQSLTTPASNDRTVTFTNTGTLTTTSAAPSSSAAPTTTTVTITPSASATDALANTGSKDVGPTTIIGALLVLLGLGMLFAGRPKRAGH